MFLVTCTDKDRHAANNGQMFQNCADMAEARTTAEEWAKAGYDAVRVWSFTASVSIEPKPVWVETARGLT